jgi:regulator of sigma E protease
MTGMLAGLPGPLVTAIYFVVALFPLVLIHEIGHFAVAKLSKVRVDEFGLGFPPRLWRLAKIGDTEYTLNALPLGGFVRLAGEDDPTVPGAFASRSKRARTAVLVAGPVANFAFAALVFSGVAYAGLVPAFVAGIDGVRVSSVTPGSPAASAGLRVGDLIVGTDSAALVTGDASASATERVQGGLDELTKRADAATGRALTLTVIRGALVALPRGAIVDLTSGAATDLPGVTGRRLTGAQAAGSPVRVGDVVIATDPTADGDGQATVVLRDAQVLRLAVTPVRAAPGEPGRMGVQISVPSVPVRYGLVGALAHGVKLTGAGLGTMVTMLGQMIVGRASVEIHGPVGISIMSRQFGEQGPVALLEFMAILSLNLGLINLLPLPALDGGRLLFIGAEALRGRRVEPAREQVVHLVGMVAVLALMAVITVVEIVRLSGGASP